MSGRPVIFLAFANDHQSYLYKLTEEQNAIRRALKQMDKEGLCEVVYETDTDLDKIWSSFDEYQDRIAIFHYGGHAEDYSLLLQKPGGEQQMVDGEGLVSFLGRQKGLQLVFLNGCSSRRQAQELRDRGVPAVIGTAEPIDDEAASILSGAFYAGLAAGRSIEQAWLGAGDLVRSDKNRKEKGFHRGIKLKDPAGQYTRDFPWELYIRPGAEQVKDWNLPAAAQNPLFGLPLPDEAFLRLPSAPFVGLHYFRQEDAAVFHGRGAQIRELYNHLQGIHPIILLYGKSGVGKSSMLDAGLLPRIKDQYEITYVRRIQEKGLLGTLDLALDELLRETATPEASEKGQDHRDADLALLRETALKVTDEQVRTQIERLLQKLDRDEDRQAIALSGILAKWRDIERVARRPLIVILDQVEEKFTRPMPGQQDELSGFLMAIRPLFSTQDSGIKGKLVLSYRKEYHPEIRDAFHSLSLPYAELFLKRLDREGIIEAVRGGTRYDRIENGVIRHNPKYNPYRLELEHSPGGNLPEIIADDLMEDPESPIAPVLQIILEKLWKTADRAEGQPVKLTIAQYQELRKQGTTMAEFFREQMVKLAAKQPEAVRSGLALDLLHAHTTPMGTAGSYRREALLERYEVAAPVIGDLLKELLDLSLLIQSDTPVQNGDHKTYTTFLAHDTLAPVVILEYNLSDAPGQRAARILNNKMADVGFRNAPALIAEWRSYKGAQKIEEEDLAELEKEYTGLGKFLAAGEAALGAERFAAEKENILQQVQINFQAGENEILLGDSDLAIVETGTGVKTGSFPGMRKLWRPEAELLRLSQERRDQQLEAARKAREEKERLIAAQLKAEQEAKEQAEENLRNQQRAARRQRLFSGIIGIALILALALGIRASQKSREAQQNLEEFQKAEASDMRKEVLDMLERAGTLQGRGFTDEPRTLLERAREKLQKYNQNPQLDGLRDTVDLVLKQAH